MLLALVSDNFPANGEFYKESDLLGSSNNFGAALFPRDSCSMHLIPCEPEQELILFCRDL